MPGDDILSRDDAPSLLDELRELLTPLRDGEETRDVSGETRRLVASLAQLLLPTRLRRSRAKELSAWADLLLRHRGEKGREVPGQVASLVEKEILDLQRLVKNPPAS